MGTPDASFRVRTLHAGKADEADVDAALAVYSRNLSPLLRTHTNQIRAKIRRPKTPQGTFYFVALYRGLTVIGFAMFGYYPRLRVLVMDHMVIDAAQRGASAFHVFSHLLLDLIDNIGLEVDFGVVEVERSNEFGGHQTGGKELVRLLGQVGYGEVHTPYALPNTEPKNYEARYDGYLMLRGPEKIHQIRREDLLAIYDSILFEHYLPWYADFFGDGTADYATYLSTLYREFEGRLVDRPVVMINGAVEDQLVPQPPRPPARSSEATAAFYVCMFSACVLVTAGAAYILKVPTAMLVPVCLALLVVFAGVISVASGRAFEVLDRTLLNLPSGRNKSRYPQSRGKTGDGGKARPVARKKLQS